MTPLRMVGMVLCLMLGYGAPGIATADTREGGAGGAEVTTTNGDVVRGEILGNLLLLGDVKEEPQGAATEYLVTYHPTDARYIRRIDGSGVHVEGDSPLVVLVASRQDSPPGHLEVVGAAMDALMRGPVETIFESLPGGGSVIGRAGRRGEAGVLSHRILGEIQKDDGGWRITPAIRIETEHGIETVPIDRIVPFE